jgi:hypothetical protein
MPGRHQHGTTNKGYGEKIAAIPRPTLEQGHHYFVSIYEGVNRQCIHKIDSATVDEVVDAIEKYGPHGQGLAVYWRDRMLYPWFENAV